MYDRGIAARKISEYDKEQQLKIGNQLDFDDLMIQMANIPKELAILPVNDAVVFPLMMVPLILRDPNLLRLADEALAEHKIIGAFTQQNQEADHPGPQDIFKIGTAIHIQKMIRFPNGEMRLLAQGISRIRLIGDDAGGAVSARAGRGGRRPGDTTPIRKKPICRPSCARFRR